MDGFGNAIEAVEESDGIVGIGGMGECLSSKGSETGDECVVEQGIRDVKALSTSFSNASHALVLGAPPPSEVEAVGPPKRRLGNGAWRTDICDPNAGWR
jgi:hypothetical protein